MFSQGKGILKWIRAIIKKQVNSMGIIKVNSSHTKNKSLNTDFLWDTPHYTQTSPQKGMHACHPDARQTPTCRPLSSPVENLSVSQGLETHFKISELSMHNIYIFPQINGLVGFNDRDCHPGSSLCCQSSSVGKRLLVRLVRPQIGGSPQGFSPGAFLTKCELEGAWLLLSGWGGSHLHLLPWSHVKHGDSYTD